MKTTMLMVALAGCSQGEEYGSRQEALAAPWMEGGDPDLRPDACGCDGLEERVAALEEQCEPSTLYWRTASSEIAADGDCEGQALVALCDPGHAVLSGSCMGTAALYDAGGPVVRDGGRGWAFGWECYLPDAGGSCGVAVTALCDPR